MIGETIKDFTITARLGRGGMGEVFVGEQRLIKTKVAIKMLMPEISGNQAHVDRFFNEAIAVSKIKHAGIVKIFDVGFHAGRAYLVMEYLDGEPLSARLRTPLPFAKAIEIARQITSVLDATHAAGITHRDLKPDNIFLVPDAELGERVRILDFGIAKLGDVKATAAQMSMGTPAYMAPELWQDAATSGPPTDVYALGCMLFEMLCGRPPFPVTAIPEACGKHLHETPPRLRSRRPELPAALDDLIAAMLAKPQAERPTIKRIASTLAEARDVTGLASTVPPTPSVEATAPSGPGRASGTAIGHESSTPGAPLPRDPAVSDEDAALAASYEADKRWMDLVKLLAKQAEVVAPANRAAYHLRVAEIYQDRFANQAEAVKAYERVLEHDRGNRKAIDQLRSLYEKRRDWEKYFELEKSELDRLPAEQQRDRAVELARLAANRIAKPEVTIYWWQRVLEFEPDHRQAMAELAKSFERAERWMDLTAILEQRIELAAGDDEQIEALTKLAAVREVQLHDLEGARDAWQRVIALDPKRAEAQNAFQRLDAATTDPPKPSTTAPSTPTSAAATSPIAPAKVDTPVEKSRAPAPVAPGRRSPAIKIAIGVGVVAAAGLAIYFVTRSPKALAERDLGTPSPRLLQVLGDKHIAYRVVDGRVLVAADAPEIQIIAEVTPPVDTVAAPVDTVATVAANGLTLSYRVLTRPAAGGELRAVKPGDQLHSDDRLVFEVMLSEQAHFYLAQRPKGRHLGVIFPSAGVAVSNPLPANTWVRLPTGDKSFRINGSDIGIETAYFMAAREPIKDLERAIKNEGVTADLNWQVDDAIVRVAMANRTDCSDKGREIVLDGDDDCKAKTRGIELDDETGTKHPARRVRAIKQEDAVFVPFSFKHVAAIPTGDSTGDAEGPGGSGPGVGGLGPPGQPKDRRPHVAIGSAQGGGTRPDLLVTLARAKSALTACYAAGLTSNPTLTGKVVVGIEIAESGRVKNTRTVSSTLDSISVETCVNAKLRGLVFVAGNDTVTAQAPFVFFTAD